MKILLTYTAGPLKDWEGQSYIDRVIENCRSIADNPYEFVSDPAEADVILFVESNSFKGSWYVQVLENEPFVQKYPEKCFTFNTDICARHMLPGVYTALKRSEAHDFTFIRSGCYLAEQSRPSEKYDFDTWDRTKHLYSFRGAYSAPVRQAIFDNEVLPTHGAITRVDRWFDHTVDEQDVYFQEILDSKFVLCPRGLSPSSHRLYEVMELGRVPVILSDEWIAPDGPAWLTFSLRISESRLDEIPNILRAYEPQACAMGRMAREAWERWFSPGQRAMTTFSYIEDMLLQRGSDFDGKAMIKHWHSHEFHRKNGWLFSQRLSTKVRKMAGMKVE